MLKSRKIKCLVSSVLRELDHNLCRRMFRIIYPLSFIPQVMNKDTLNQKVC